ncbi:MULTISPECIES: RNA polymerase sigma factor [Xanthobacter]|uniref:RNA polymerase sigma factor n=1 Tax=Xanthobacter TaxID=279 RepID=UPI001E4DA946|nr:sigma factor-like helix-turn-helix DNA-binding protein [Xanthobacter autotrophicus]UDQ88538.1 RNA polymerase subunit sigma-70 [Xanthobacter autotrophicus]
MMTNRREADGRHSGDDAEGHGAAKPADAAVRRALVEAREEFLVFLHHRVGGRDEAEELLQQFSLRALEHAWQLRDVRTVRGWLGRILATTLVDHQRRAIRRRRREIDMERSDVENLATEPDRETDEAVCNCLHKLLPTLKPEYADVVWRSDILGEPRDRIAASLGTTLNNIAVRLHRGRQALRTRLEEMCVTCPVHGFLDCRCDEAERIRQRIHGLADEPKTPSKDG